MLRRLPKHDLVRGCTEILADAVLYVGVILIVIVVLGQAARLAL